MLALWAGWREGKRFNTKVPDGAEQSSVLLGLVLLDAPVTVIFCSVCWSKQDKETDELYVFVYNDIYFFIYTGIIITTAFEHSNSVI